MVCRDMMVGLARVMVRYALLQVDLPRPGAEPELCLNSNTI